jgi:ketosteroid isomerase-like protein
MSDNTALIQDLFGSIAQEGCSTKFNDALADDLVWVATGSSLVAGTYKGK